MPPHTVVRLSRRSVSHKADKLVAARYLTGPIDHYVHPVIPIAVVFVFQSSNDSIPLDRFEIALSSTLSSYPHLTGRLVLTEKGGYEVVSLGEGASFYEAKCDQTLDHLKKGRKRIRMPDLPGEGNDLMPPFDPSMESITRDPVLEIQYTRFSCGGVSLGIRIRHKLCDGMGFFQFVADLAEMYGRLKAGSGYLTVEPAIQSYRSEEMDNAQNTQIRGRPLYQSSLFSPSVPLTPAASDLPSNIAPPPITGRFIYISDSRLSSLKSLALDPSADKWISTFESLAAFLFQRIHLARVKLRLMDSSQSALGQPCFLTSVDIRRRIPDLSQRYFPNCVFTAFSDVARETLEADELPQIAQIVHALVRSPLVTESAVIESEIDWILQNDRRTMVSRFRGGNGAFMVAAWNKLGVRHRFSFDGTDPALISTPFTSISLVDGLAYFLAADDAEEGGLEICLSLSDPLWGVLDQDEVFSKYCGGDIA